MMKVTKKVNHDSLWLKVQDTKTKSWAKVTVGRGGVKATTKNTEGDRPRFRDYTKTMFEHMTDDSLGSYGEKLDSLENKMNQLFTE